MLIGQYFRISELYEYLMLDLTLGINHQSTLET